MMQLQFRTSANLRPRRPGNSRARGDVARWREKRKFTAAMLAGDWVGMVVKPCGMYAIFFAALILVMRETAPASLDGPTRMYWATSAVSLIHGVVISYLAWHAMTPFWTSFDLHLVTPESIRCQQIYLGYVTADLVPLFWHRRQWPGTTAYLGHHIVSLLCWGLLLARGELHGFGAGLLILEATAPFTNGRWFLHTLGRKDTTFYVVNGVCMALSFFALRIVYAGWLVMRYAIGQGALVSGLPLSTRVVSFGGFAFGYGLQFFWFRKIVQGMIKALGGGSGKKGAKKRA